MRSVVTTTPRSCTHGYRKPRRTLAAVKQCSEFSVTWIVRAKNCESGSCRSVARSGVKNHAGSPARLFGIGAKDESVLPTCDEPGSVGSVDWVRKAMNLKTNY